MCSLDTCVTGKFVVRISDTRKGGDKDRFQQSLEHGLQRVQGAPRSQALEGEEETLWQKFAYRQKFDQKLADEFEADLTLKLKEKGLDVHQLDSEAERKRADKKLEALKADYEQKLKILSSDWARPSPAGRVPVAIRVTHDPSG